MGRLAQGVAVVGEDFIDGGEDLVAGAAGAVIDGHGQTERLCRGHVLIEPYVRQDDKSRSEIS